MPKLPKFTASFNEKKDRWQVSNDKTDKVIKTFGTKEDMTARGVLRKAVGSAGGSVKIQKVDGKYQEERTYPKSKDPKGSKG